nr:MAG TPA: hypothetical protein [Caudoviricetes sp.]
MVDELSPKSDPELAGKKIYLLCIYCTIIDTFCI